MKRFTIIILCVALFCGGCASSEKPARIAATTLPVYEFTSRLCRGTELSVTRLVTESVSCLHDYTLNVRQVKAAEAAEVIVISGAGMEAFMEDVLNGADVLIDASWGIELLGCTEDHDHGHDHHHHEVDGHIWLSPENAKMMATNICLGLTEKYPRWKAVMQDNLAELLGELDALQEYGENQLSSLSCREMVTFHDGFSYFAHSFGLTILEALEEEAGSEASAGELVRLVEIVREHTLPAVFTEVNGSAYAARIIAAETGVKLRSLNMAMSGDSYFEAMYHNIDAVKEAMG